MDFDIVKKNKPKLINDDILEKVILNKKNIIDTKYEPTLLDKILNRIKNYLYETIEQNIFIIIFIIIIIILLIYRYYQYKMIKQNIHNIQLTTEKPLIPESFNNKISKISTETNSIELVESTENKNKNIVNILTYNSNDLNKYETW